MSRHCNRILLSEDGNRAGFRKVIFYVEPQFLSKLHRLIKSKYWIIFPSKAQNYFDDFFVNCWSKWKIP